MRAQIIKDCSNLDSRLFIGRQVDCDMQVLYGSNQWDRNYKVYFDDNDFDGCLVPLNAVESLDNDYLKLKERIDIENRNRQIRFINSWINIIVSVGPRGGVKEIMFNTLTDSKVNTIGRTKGKYYLTLLNELGIEYKQIQSR
jgi:hypothetical protein